MGSSIGEAITLLASAARTATSTGEAAVNVQDIVPRPARGMVFCLDVTAAATDAGDLLDVYVQAKIGDNWVDVVHFTQVLGNGGAKRYYSGIAAGAAVTEFENAAALGAAASRGILGKELRVRYTVTDAGADNASWTFSVTATPQ